MIWIGPLQLQLDISLAGHHAVWEATTCKHDYVPHFALAKKEKAMFSLKESVSVLIALIIFDVFHFVNPWFLGILLGHVLCPSWSRKNQTSAMISAMGPGRNGPVSSAKWPRAQDFKMIRAIFLSVLGGFWTLKKAKKELG